jgi:hypothetical protein
VLDILCPELFLLIKFWVRKNYLHMLQLDRRIIIPEWNEGMRNKQGLNVKTKVNGQFSGGSIAPQVEEGA